ncbi:ABC transporter ATP-binding protein [Nonomuraea sp. NPDC052116]|uniref:ABC transporter ATP-binding protein n=1 Tax=Nonomuraea sp. NPDC052116 TaxID=3155665 RepID=UPI0034429E2B
MLANPAMAVLDESTAETGSVGACALERAVDRAVDDRTAVIVAHRLTQVAIADSVVVLEDGRIVERGSHGDLRAAVGRYAAHWVAWAVPRPQQDDELVVALRTTSWARHVTDPAR